MNLIANEERIDKLTKAEYNMLVMLSHGYTKRQIAEHLEIQFNSVQSATHRVYTRLGIDQTNLDKSAIALLVYWGIATFNEIEDTLVFHSSPVYDRTK